MPNLKSKVSKTTTANVEPTTPNTTSVEVVSKVSRVDTKSAESKVSPEETKLAESKEYSVEETLEMMSYESGRLTTLKDQIIPIQNEIAQLKLERDDLRKKIKPIRKGWSTFSPDSSTSIRVTPIERREIRHKVAIISNRIILKKDKLAELRTSYSKNSTNVSNFIKSSTLRNKAQSKDWIKRNLRTVEGRVLKALNNLRSEEPATMRELAKAATSKSSDSALKFESLLKQTLDRFDPETSVLCSHGLKKNLYRKIGLTLKAWNPRKNGRITELVTK